MRKERRFKTAIHWFRRDLRVRDNTALLAAAHAAERVVPVYVVSDWKEHHGWTSAVRQEFLCGCLDALAQNLAARGGRLIFRTGRRADAVLAALLAETGAEAIFFNHDPDPYGVAMERSVAAMAREHGAEAFGCKDVALHERDELLNGSGLPYRMYAPYARAWTKLEKPAVGTNIEALRTPEAVRSEPSPTLAHWDLSPSGAEFVEPGERAARTRLKRFLENALSGYATGRNSPAGQSASSRLSQDLRWGLVSAREVYHRCREVLEVPDATADEQAGAQKFLSELAWREFCLQLLFHFPEVLDTEFNPRMRGLPWLGAEGNESYARWTRGETGFPIVDAGMRQLRATGFMHNRVRMIVAMFLTKDLRVHWREGERWFNQRLIDGDIANNNTNWQWCAGTGADAAPYFRIQNPWTQSARHDPQGEYIKRFLPELRDVSAEKLHAPPATGERLAQGYPAPILDHGEERGRTLEMFKRHLRK
jgi:deoxyribodipyrimidine photo-lyase